MLTPDPGQHQQSTDGVNLVEQHLLESLIEDLLWVSKPAPWSSIRTFPRFHLVPLYRSSLVLRCSLRPAPPWGKIPLPTIASAHISIWGSRPYMSLYNAATPIVLEMPLTSAFNCASRGDQATPHCKLAQCPMVLPSNSIQPPLHDRRS